MKKNTKILLLVFLLVVFAFSLKLWAGNSLIGGEEYPSATIDPEIELAFEFAYALVRNDPSAYEMIDADLKPRLDEWMSLHRSQECVRDIDYSRINSGTNLGYEIRFGCVTKTSYLDFEIDDIVIIEMKVIDWGEVTEED